MKTRVPIAVAVLALFAAGCVARTHEESAALRSTWPMDKTGALTAAGGPDIGWPSVSGDIARGTSPEALAKARAEMSQPLTEALAKP
jgi:hypothetical protein